MSQNPIRLRLAQDRAVRTVDETLMAAEAAGCLNVDAAMLESAILRLGELTAEHALRRLVAQGRLLRPSARIAHWVIVPVRFQGGTALPAEVWIDAYFADTLQLEYYVGLLTAAAIFGAVPGTETLAHIAVERSRASMSMGSFECRFHAQPSIRCAPTQWHAGEFGRVRVSTLEMTALDLSKRQARRVAGFDLRPVIDSLLARSSPEGMQRALGAVQNADAAERLATAAHRVSPKVHAVIAAWCEAFRDNQSVLPRAAARLTAQPG
jgi:AbiEi antitoxin C-terminal domain